ncbi:MAG: M16 family metallopeptidase, partial [Gammaproteobacteria bacterium]
MLRRLVLLCLFVCLPIAQAAPPVQSWWLDNGTRVYYIGSEQLPMVDVQLVFDAAGARDGDLPGLARLTNAMMSEGAGGRSAEEISLGFERLGAEFDSQSLKDMSVFSLRSLVEPDKLDEAVALLSDVLGKPDFPADAFERLRKQMLAALDAEAQSPRAIVNREFFKALYGDHPYAQPAQGTRESIERMTLEDIRAFYRHYMVGKNAVVAIVGDLDLIEASRLAERITAGLAPGEAAPALPKPEPLAESRTIRIHHPSTQTHIMTGQVGIARADLDLFSLYVGNH